MKTGMGNGLILIVVLVACGIGMSVLQAQQVELATAQVQATTAAAQMPLIETMLGQLGGWLIKFSLGVVVAGVAGMGFAWLRLKLRPASRRAWRSGPNAQWQHREPRERGVTTTDLLKIMMMQNGQRPQQRSQDQNAADEPQIWS